MAFWVFAGWEGTLDIHDFPQKGNSGHPRELWRELWTSMTSPQKRNSGGTLDIHDFPQRN